MKRFFITASGTGAGKTLVTSLLVRQLRARQKSVRALKPLVTGFTDETARGSDTWHLLDAMGQPMNPDNIASVSPWRFEAPLAPNMAARHENRQIDLAEIIAFCNAAGNNGEEYLLVEGVGGVLAPLDETHTVRDWIQAVRMPALLVTGSYLGSISHTLTALEALQTRNIPVTAIIVSESPDSPVSFRETLETLNNFAGDVPLFGLPWLTDIVNAPDMTYLVNSIN